MVQELTISATKNMFQAEISAFERKKKTTFKASAKAAAPASLISFPFRSSVWRDLFNCKKLIEKTGLVAANQAQNTWKLVERIRNNVNKISLCLEPQRLRQRWNG